MADGLCTGGPIGDVIEKTAVNVIDNTIVCETNDSMDVPVKNFYIASESAKLFAELCANDGETAKHEGFLSCEEDCRKKRCVDRYDSSESSDSSEGEFCHQQKEICSNKYPEDQMKAAFDVVTRGESIASA
ncbi:hypothetical protein JTB14_028605 [Gonioctena quinquepunctata]|nr:hypothetical protein JTB14_028605 [Gonioctena quinquepunctata]